MHYSYLPLLFLLVSQLVQVNAQPHLDTALTYLDVKELTGNNDGLEVEKFLKSVGRKKGDSWCASFVSYTLIATNTKEPKIRSGVAQKFITKKSIKAIDVLTGKIKIEPGALCIWKQGNTWQGHIGIVINWDKRKGKTIEGNTSPQEKNSQYNGDGVYIKNRSIFPGNYFRITHFTEVIN